MNDLPRSIRFYTEGLGFSVGEEWKEDGKLTGVMIHSEKVFLMLGQGDFAKGRDRVKGVGSTTARARRTRACAGDRPRRETRRRWHGVVDARRSPHRLAVVHKRLSSWICPV